MLGLGIYGLCAGVLRVWLAVAWALPGFGGSLWFPLD